MPSISRRRFLAITPAAALVPSLLSAQQPTAAEVAAGAPRVPAAFPAQDPAAVREFVTVSHFNVERVREMVSLHPALARSTWDWGFGDWETALGAASHVGNREIADLLIANGARPSLFSAAMLGQLDVVKAFVAAQPGCQRIRGPHGITLLAHARNGGPQAAEVAKYLGSLGDADPRYPDLPLGQAQQSALIGSYAFGTGLADRMIVSKDVKGALLIKREGTTDRNLYHQGSMVFNPAGAEAVRIRFSIQGDLATEVVIEDGDLRVTARRTA